MRAEQMPRTLFVFFFWQREQFRGQKEMEKLPMEEKHIMLGNRDKSMTIFL